MSVAQEELDQYKIAFAERGHTTVAYGLLVELIQYIQQCTEISPILKEYYSESLYKIVQGEDPLAALHLKLSNRVQSKALTALFDSYLYGIINTIMDEYDLSIEKAIEKFVLENDDLILQEDAVKQRYYRIKKMGDFTTVFDPQTQAQSLVPHVENFDSAIGFLPSAYNKYLEGFKSKGNFTFSSFNEFWAEYLQEMRL